MIDTGAKLAVISADQRHRFMLQRTWGPDPKKMALFIGLNPSTADDEKDDPTSKRVYGFSRAMGMDRFVLWNPFAYRTKSPKVLLKVYPPEDAIGPGNDEWLEYLASQAQIVICAWGANAKHPMVKRRIWAVLDLLAPICDLHVLRMTEKTNQPEHPLMLPDGLTPKLWKTRRLP